jgi:hypothetical protein
MLQSLTCNQTFSPRRPARLARTPASPSKVVALSF